MKRITWKKCGGYHGEHMCDVPEDKKPDYAIFKNIRSGKYYCAECLFQCKEFDKILRELMLPSVQLREQLKACRK